MKKSNLPPLQGGLLVTLSSLDNQIAREMQRTPKELAAQGVQKWEPIAKRIEMITVFLLEQFSRQKFGLEALLVLTQAGTKALRMIVEEVGTEGLGQVRTGYVTKALESLEEDSRKGLELLVDPQERLN